MRILVTGGTGFIGAALTEELRCQGREIVLLTRREAPPAGEPMAAEWLRGVGAIINMAGENIAGRRWSDQYKQKIRDSRINLTRSLVQTCRNCKEKGQAIPQVMISFSAVGYYGNDPAIDFDESHSAGSDWLAGVARDWEREAAAVQEYGVRLLICRLGVVLGPGGFLQRLALPFRLFVGGPAGDGRQWISWIHRDDVLAVVCEALKNERFEGTFNLTAPEPATMEMMAATIGQVLGRPSWLRVPAFALKMLLGEMAESLILGGQRVLPKRLQAIEWKYRQPELLQAVQNAFGSHPSNKN